MLSLFHNLIADTQLGNDDEKSQSIKLIDGYAFVCLPATAILVWSIHQQTTMGILKTLTVSHKREENGNYSILLTKTPAINQPCLILEAGTVVSLGPEDADKVRKTGGYIKVLDAYACLGMLQYAYEGSKEVLFLLIVTGCNSVGKIQNSEIFCITEVVPFSMRNVPEDQQLIKDLKTLLEMGSFYFSHSTMPYQEPYDLTLSAQRAYLAAQTSKTVISDNRFFWNRLLHRHFERFNIVTSNWLVKVLCGGVNIKTVYIGGLQAKACLISRLSCERAGTRFIVRGVDDLGHVANFVETEQVIFINQIVLSYLIIRGSIPLFWEQPGIQIGSHRIKMSRGSEISQPGYDKHMFLLRERYDNVVVINLLSAQKESELALNQLFNLHHKSSHVGSEFTFINFDFHALCPYDNRENLDKLYVHELEKYCDQFGFFHSEKGEISQIQRGVMRVNCLDCLDRTNRVQTYVGLKMLGKLIKSLERVEVDKVMPRLIGVYETSWSVNGNQISQLYAGTDALDGKNLLKDGATALKRNYQTLNDSAKQTAYDILTMGRTLNRDYSYRAATLLPHYYIYSSPSILVQMCDRYLDYCKPEKLKVVIGTWNVNGGRHFDNIMHNRARPLADWLVDYKTSAESVTGEANLLDQDFTNTPVDIYAIGFQEIVDLNAGNIVASSTQNQRDWLVEIQRVISKDNQYLLVTSVQLVGVCLFVFIRSNLAPYIKDVCNHQAKTGLRGAAGNKGGVAIRFRYKATSLCFVCAHFAAGQHQVKERNHDYAEITRNIQFPMGRSINSHDYVFWCGDFNYRLDKISNDEARRSALIGNFDLLLQYDQLKISQAAGQTFKGYMEGDINFAPTYKYDVNTKDYDSSEKCRVPAYTDRILFKKCHETHPDEELTDLGQVKFYNRIELMSSDHRPVIAELEIEVLEIDKECRNQVFDSVLDESGPQDSTIFVRVDGHLDVTDEIVFDSILKMLAEEAGEIVLVRYIKSSLMIIFGDGKSAVKALALDGCSISGQLPDNRLLVNLRTENWHDALRDELHNNRDNTTNLVSGNAPSVHLEDDEDEAAQELNMSIGPEVNPDTICLANDIFMTAEQPRNDPSLVPASIFAPVQATQEDHLYKAPIQHPPPKSPMHPPSRPPPPPPQSSTNVPTMAKRELPPRPIISSATITPTPTTDPFGWTDPNENRQSCLDETSSEFTGDSTFAEESSINLVELSTSIDYEESTMLPPPTMAAPILPPLTPSKLPPSVPPQPPMGQLTKPTRAAPPPPIPDRNQTNSENPERVRI